MQMILTGPLDSPFSRRVAVSLSYYGIAFEHRPLSTFADFDEVFKTNPTGKIPALTLDNGEVLIDSTAMLDHLDETVGSERALMPASGVERRKVMRRTMVGLGLAEKFIALRFELVRRREGTQDPDVVARIERQIASSLAWLEDQAPSPLFEPVRGLRQDDITCATAISDMRYKKSPLFQASRFPALAALADHCEALPAFVANPFPANPVPGAG